MISIIDDNGSRQFSVHHLVQKIALIAGVGTLAIVVLYFIAAHFLMSELEVILANNTQVRENFQSIYVSCIMSLCIVVKMSLRH